MEYDTIFRDPVLANFHDYGFPAAITKPYELQELARTIQKVLES